MEKTCTNIFDSGISGEKIIKRLIGESWKQFKFEPYYTCEQTSQLSYKSRVPHSVMVVHACGVYSRGGPPAILTILHISVHMSTKICNWKYGQNMRYVRAHWSRDQSQYTAPVPVPWKKLEICKGTLAQGAVLVYGHQFHGHGQNMRCIRTH